MPLPVRWIYDKWKYNWLKAKNALWSSLNSSCRSSAALQGGMCSCLFSDFIFQLASTWGENTLKKDFPSFFSIKSFCKGCCLDKLRPLFKKCNILLVNSFFLELLANFKVATINHSIKNKTNPPFKMQCCYPLAKLHNVQERKVKY